MLEILLDGGVVLLSGGEIAGLKVLSQLLEFLEEILGVGLRRGIRQKPEKTAAGDADYGH